MIKWFFAFVFGFAAGVVTTYLIDPKGTRARYDSMRSELEESEKKLGKKIGTYKKAYNEMVDKYASAGKEVIEKTKGKVHFN